MKKKIAEFFQSSWSVSEKCLLAADLLLLGVLIGWITSPLKNGFGFFSNNSWDIQTGCADTEEEE